MLPKENKLIKVAKALATKAHAGQFRWDGKTPYTTHPEAVAKSFYPPPLHIPKDILPLCIATAWLHDVIEDTPLGCVDLSEAKLPMIVIDAVRALTKGIGEHYLENYLEYILRVKQNSIATEVKIQDIQHNMLDLGDKQKQRKEKYLCALHILKH